MEWKEHISAATVGIPCSEGLKRVWPYINLIMAVIESMNPDVQRQAAGAVSGAFTTYAEALPVSPVS